MLEASTLNLLRLPPRRKIGDLSSRNAHENVARLRASVPSHALLVLDEPFSGFDPLVRDEFMESLIQQAARDDRA